MRICPALAAAALLLCAPAQGETFTLIGFLQGRTVAANGPRTWLEGGFGRLESSREAAFAVAQIGGEWEPSRYFDAHLQTIARAQPSRERGKHIGVVEAWVEGRTFIGTDELQLRAGQFFLPTSRENTGQFWTSPYLITYSALNTWIGEEFRPVGADLQWKHNLPNQNVLTLAATAFQHNDSAGALLGWRGWSVGNRLTVYDEVLPLPPLFSLDHPNGFADQRRDGTEPFERDLDGRIGIAARARFTMPDRATVQLTHVDNRGDRNEHFGEYAWRTRFNIAALELGTQDATTLAAEYMWGNTAMGEPGQIARVDADFSASYLLLSHKFTRTRLSARIDRFDTTDRDHSPFEINTEHGWSGALGGFYYPAPHWRAGMELTRVTGRRIAAEQSGFSGNTNANSLTLEIRYAF